MSVGWDGRPTPKLASRWDVSPDGRTVRFHLNSSARWHNGRPFTASAARDFLLRRFRNSRVQQGSISYKSVADVQAENDSTLVVTLARREAFFLIELANSSLHDPSDPGLGTGPYKPEDAAVDLALVDKASSIRLLAATDYYRGRPGTTAVELKRYDDQRAAWAALMRGEIDAVHETSPSAMEFVEKQSTVRTFPHTRPYFIQVLFNLKHPILRHAAVRQAMSHAVGRPDIIRGALNGRGIVADGPVWPEHWAHSAAAKTYAQNVEAATLLLDGAGFKRDARNSARGAARFSFTCLTLAGDARYEKIGLLLQKQLYDVGIDMQVQALPWAELQQRIGRADFDALLMERTSGRSLTWTYMTFHSSYAPFGYTAADDVLDRMRSAVSESEIRQTVNEFQRIIYEDPPAIFLTWPVVARAVSSAFAVPDEPGRDVMGSLWQWKPAARSSP